MNIIGELVTDKAKKQIAKGAGLLVLGGVSDLVEKTSQKKKDDFKQNDLFSQQLICNGIDKNISGSQICRIFDSDEKVKYRLWFLNRKKCLIYDTQSFQVANIVMDKSFLGGVKGFQFFQGTKKFGSVIGKYKFGECFQVEFNGWTINGKNNYCDIYDKNMKHIAQIKRESHNWKSRSIRRGIRSGGISIRRSPYYAYAINYDDCINEVMILLIIAMMSFSS